MNSNGPGRYKSFTHIEHRASRRGWPRGIGALISVLMTCHHGDLGRTSSIFVASGHLGLKGTEYSLGMSVKSTLSGEGRNHDAENI